MGLHKILKILVLILSLIGAIFALMVIAGDEESAASTGGNMLYVAYAVLGLAIALVLIYVLKGLASGNAKKTLLSIGLFAGIILISYLMATGSDLDVIAKGFADTTESTSKYVGTGLIAFYILAIVAIGAMVLSGAKKMIKN